MLIFEKYLEGQGDLASRLITPITHIVTLVILVLTRLPKSPPPSSTCQLHSHQKS